MNTADLAVAREALATHIYLTEDPLNHAAAMELLDAAMNVAFEVGRSAERAAIAGLPELTLPKLTVLSQYGAQLDKERAEAMKAAQ